MLINDLSKLDPGAKRAKADLKSAFQTLPLSLDDNLGCTEDMKYYVNVTMPISAKVNCATYKKFNTFLHCVVENESQYD